MSEESKTERLEARLTESVFALIRNAASMQGRSLSEFVVESAREAAERVVSGHEIIRLSVEDQQRFADCLFEEPAIAPALQQAMQRHQDMVEPS